MPDLSTVSQFQAVGDVPVALDGKQEVGGGPLMPTLGRFLLGQTVEAGIQLHRVKDRRVVLQFLIPAKVFRVEDSPPMLIRPA